MLAEPKTLSYKKLFESIKHEPQNAFVEMESSQIPLTEVPYDTIKQKLVDPTTGKPYKGIILEGVFADLNSTPNNNNRIYDIPEYLVLLQILKKQIHSEKGVYGELEHPEGYAVNSNNVSHKILDVWYNETEKKVYGRVLILNRGNGLIAAEIIKSGGCLAISARAAGKEVKNSDGTIKAITKLLTTFDLVYHPGFSLAVLAFKELNESQKFTQNVANQKIGFSGRIYIKDLKNLGNKYEEFINLNESINDVQSCFLEHYFNLNENKQEENQQEVMEQNQASDEDKIQNKLQKVTDEDLNESKNIFITQMNTAQKKLRKSQLDKNDESNSYYDDSAGFVISE